MKQTGSFWMCCLIAFNTLAPCLQKFKKVCIQLWTGWQIQRQICCSHVNFQRYATSASVWLSIFLYVRSWQIRPLIVDVAFLILVAGFNQLHNNGRVSDMYYLHSLEEMEALQLESGEHLTFTYIHWNRWQHCNCLKN